MQALAISVMALAICGQQNRAAMRRHGVRTTGWWMERSDWKTASLYSIGTSGQNASVETSPSRASPTACVVICRVLEFIISFTSGQDHCVAAIAKKLTACASAMAARIGRSGVTRPSSGQSSAVGEGEVGCAVSGGLLKASATMFSWPCVCLISDVNSAMK
jgi:hypothetical protein